MKNKKPKLLLVGFVLLFSGYVFYKNVTFGIAYVPENEFLYQTYIHKIPQNLYFAGEEIPFKNKESYRYFYKELKYRTAKNAYTKQALKNAGIWFPVIEKILKEYKLPDDLKYLALAESNLTNSRSPKGAVGIWQFTKKSGQALGLVINDEIDERLDPEKSTRAACKYLKRLYGYFGSWAAAAAAYNLGENALFIAFKRQQVNDYFDLKLNRETSAYIYRVLALKDLVENPKKYKMQYRRYTMPPYKYIAVKEPISDVAEFAKMRNISTQTFSALNPWIITNKLTPDSTMSVFYIRVPKN